MSEVEQLVMSIVEAIGVPLILKLISGSTPQEQVQAILDAEYKAAEDAFRVAEAAKFK